MTATEYVVLVDDYDNEIGTSEKLLAHQQSLLHRAFSVFIFRSHPQTDNIELLLQQRAIHKYHSPGLWTNTCCSHPRPGESVVKAAERRLLEEMGMKVSLEDVGSFKYLAQFSNGLAEHEFDHVLVGWVDESTEIKMNPVEVNAWQWMNIEDLRYELENNPKEYSAWILQGLALAYPDAT